MKLTWVYWVYCRPKCTMYFRVYMSLTVAGKMNDTPGLVALKTPTNIVQVEICLCIFASHATISFKYFRYTLQNKKQQNPGVAGFSTSSLELHSTEKAMNGEIYEY